MTALLKVLDDPEIAAELAETQDYVPRIGLAPELRDWKPGPDHRPGPFEATIACEHGHPSQPKTLAWCFYVRDCEDARSGSWWRAHLPAGVDFRLVAYPVGVDTVAAMRERHELAYVPGAAESADIGIEPADEVVVQTPCGPTLATLSSVRRADGRPVYFVAPVHWHRIAEALRARK